MLQRVREIIADVTGNPVQAVNESSAQQTVDGWDSLAQINIIVAVESEFGISFTADEIHSLNTVEKILGRLQSTSAKAGLV